VSANEGVAQRPFGFSSGLRYAVRLVVAGSRANLTMNITTKGSVPILGHCQGLPDAEYF
jgi:hypothetical protein